MVHSLLIAFVVTMLVVAAAVALNSAASWLGHGLEALTSVAATVVVVAVIPAAAVVASEIDASFDLVADHSRSLANYCCC